MVDAFAPQAPYGHLARVTERCTYRGFWRAEVSVARAISRPHSPVDIRKVYAFASILLPTLCIIPWFTTGWERGTTGYG
jgi:hypothetical protein